jgi:ABC-type Fe3+/spermidine/putrescine transport system ATPase subunit
MGIVIENLTKAYGNLKAVDHINLEFQKGEFVAILGPSGCGKTTLLKVIAGLIPQSEGKIYIDNKDISLIPSQKRNAAMVFQSYALFPHMSVGENVAYGLKVRGMSKENIKSKVATMLELVKLKGYEKRNIQELSGGQKQRVALARALVIEPDMLLFDEPLSNLDEQLRVEMRAEIKRIQKETGITSIYVTHDQEEAMTIADKIVVMNKGEIQQIASADDIYYSPANLFVAGFIGNSNIIECGIKRDDKGNTYAEFLNKKVQLKKEALGKIYMVIRPEEVEPCEDQYGASAKVLSRENLGVINRYKVEVEDRELFMDIINRKNIRIFEKGETVKVSFDERGIHVIYN